MRDNLPKMLRDAAKEWREENKVVATGATRYDFALEEAADAIEELSKLVDESIPKDDAEIIIAEVAKPRWIPVTDRLPEKFENCLIANKRGKHYDIDKGWWNGSFFDRCAKGGYHNVTHWMPLPEPPKEEAT